MDAVQRRAALSDYLSQAAGPVSASVLAARFSVSRQIIVCLLYTSDAADE